MRCHAESGYSEVCIGVVSLARTSRVHAQAQLLTTAQAAVMLGVHPNTIRNWADATILPSYRIGPRRDRRFRREDLDTFLLKGNPGGEDVR